MPDPVPRPLYLMAKPPREPLSQIASLPRMSAARAPSLAHVTLLPFADLADQPARFVPDLLARMRGFGAFAFHVCFDRIVEHRAVTLRPGRTPSAARTFQNGLVDYLTAGGFEAFGKPPAVHLTISYVRDGQGNEPIAPIGWRVDEVLLVESIHGKATHKVHGRWQLDPLLV